MRRLLITGVLVLAAVLLAAFVSMGIYAIRGRKRDQDALGKSAQLFLGFGDFLLHWFLWAVGPAVGSAAWSSRNRGPSSNSGV